MSARSRMTMRATVERQPAGSTNSYGEPDPGDYAEVESGVPIYAWSKMRRERDDVGKDAVLEDMQAIIPFGANILEGDQLTICDRRGCVVFDGPVYVEVKQRRTGGARKAHYKLMLRRHK